MPNLSVYGQSFITEHEYDEINQALRVETVGNSANTSVQRVSAGFMAPGQTAKQYVGKVTTSTTLVTTVTLETVTTGKTYYLTDISLFTNSSAAVDGSIQAAGTPIYNFGVSTTAPVQMAGMETQPYATTAQVVTLVLPITAAAQIVWYNLGGFEQ